MPIAIRTTLGSCLAIRQITENPELLWVSSPWTFKDGANGGGPPDFRACPKGSIALKGSSINNSPRPAKAKEKPAGKTGRDL